MYSKNYYIKICRPFRGTNLLCWTLEMTQSRMPRGLIENEQLRHLASQPCNHEWEYHKSDEEKFELKRYRRSNYHNCQQLQQQLSSIIDSMEHGFRCHDRTSSYTTRSYQDRSPRGGVLRKRRLRTSTWLRIILTPFTNLWT